MIDDEALQRLHVRHHDAQQIVGVSGHQIALHHFRAFRDRLLETLQRVFHLLFQTHLNEHVDAQPERLRIQQRDLLFEQAKLFQRTDAVETGRGRQIHRSGQIRVGDARVLLQLTENADLDAVEPFGWRGLDEIFRGAREIRNK